MGGWVWGHIRYPADYARRFIAPTVLDYGADLAQFERDIMDASGGRILGGDDAWSAGMPPEYTLTKRSGGARIF